MPDWLGIVGRRVLVAGGAGTLGAALVGGFLEQGAAVGVLDRSRDGLATLDERVAVRAQVDVSDPETSRAAVARAREELSGLDVFVHCVGINDRRPIEDYSAADWDRILAVNLTSAFHTATEAAVGMRAQGHGRILAANPARREALVELIPAGRFGKLEEVVGPVLFLASERASFITGQVLYIDGGRTIV